MTDVCCVRERLLGADAGRCRDPSGRGVQSCAETYTNRRGGRGDLETPLAHYHTWLELAPLKPPRPSRARARGRRSCWREWRHLPLAKQHPRTTIVPRATLDADRMQREKHRPPLARSLGWRAKKDHPAPLPGSFSSAPPPKVSRSGQRSAAKGVALGWSQAGRVGRVGWSAASGASDGALPRARRMERRVGRVGWSGRGGGRRSS